MPVGALWNMSDKLPFIKSRSKRANNIRWVAWRNFPEKEDKYKVSTFINMLASLELVAGLV